jgi:hypothetical protein
LSSGSGPHLLDRKGSDAAMCIVIPDPLGGLRCATCPMALNPASLLGGLRATTRPSVPYGPRISDTKKRLAGLPVQLGSYVPNAHAHISKAPDVKPIMGLQEVQVGSTVNAEKTCKHVAIVQLQCSASPVDHSPGIATVPDD